MPCSRRVHFQMLLWAFVFCNWVRGKMEMIQIITLFYQMLVYLLCICLSQENVITKIGV